MSYYFNLEFSFAEDDGSSSTKDDTSENIEIKEEKASSFEQYNQAWDNDGNLTVVW